MRPSHHILALSMLLLSTAANAQNGPAGFQSPSKNIACAYFDFAATSPKQM
jgi:hypothetical protein